jgi:hypothetical protein
MKKLLTVVLVLAIVLGALAAVQAAGVKLEYKFKQGQTGAYKMVTNMKMGVPGPAGKSQTMTMKMTADITEKVISVNKDGSVKIQFTYSNMKMAMPGQPGAQPMPNDSGILTVAKDGKVIKIEGFKSLSSMASMPGADSSMMNNMSPYGLILPKNAINIGNTWKQNVPLASIGSIVITNKLLSTSDTIGKETTCKIQQTFSGKFPASKVIMAQAGKHASAKDKKEMAQLKGNFEFSGKATCNFSPAKGRLLKQAATVKVVMDMTMPKSAQQQGAPPKMNMKMDMDIQITKVK